MKFAAKFADAVKNFLKSPNPNLDAQLDFPVQTDTINLASHQRIFISEQADGLFNVTKCAMGLNVVPSRGFAFTVSAPVSKPQTLLEAAKLSDVISHLDHVYAETPRLSAVHKEQYADWRKRAVAAETSPQPVPGMSPYLY